MKDSLGRNRKPSQDHGSRKIPKPTSSLAELDPPYWLDSPHALEFWNVATSQMAEMKILEAADAHVIATVAMAFSDMQVSRELINKHGELIVNDRGGLARNPACLSLEKARTAFLVGLGTLGLTPAARAKLAPDKPDADPLAMLAARLKKE